MLHTLTRKTPAELKAADYPQSHKKTENMRQEKLNSLQLQCCKSSRRTWPGGAIGENSVDERGLNYKEEGKFQNVGREQR